MKSLSNKPADYAAMCDQIMKMDSKIRFVGLINNKGRLIEGGMKPGVPTLSSPKEDEMLFMELVLRIKMRQEFDSQLGKVKFAMAVREKILEMSFQIDSHVLFVVTESDADYGALPKKILQVIGG
ncbi:MAG: DUF6659 family protein [Candidatus Nitrosotenuis sp.]